MDHKKVGHMYSEAPQNPKGHFCVIILRFLLLRKLCDCKVVFQGECHNLQEVLFM